MIYTIRFHSRIFVREGRYRSCKAHCSRGWSVSTGTLLLGLECVHRKCFKFRPCEIASDGGFWGPRRLVAEMLLRIEINCLKSVVGWTQVRGGYTPFSRCMKPWPSYYVNNCHIILSSVIYHLLACQLIIIKILSSSQTKVYYTFIY